MLRLVNGHIVDAYGNRVEADPPSLDADPYQKFNTLLAILEAMLRDRTSSLSAFSKTFWTDVDNLFAKKGGSYDSFIGLLASGDMYQTLDAYRIIVACYRTFGPRSYYPRNYDYRKCAEWIYKNFEEKILYVTDYVSRGSQDWNHLTSELASFGFTYNDLILQPSTENDLDYFSLDDHLGPYQFHDPVSFEPLIVELKPFFESLSIFLESDANPAVKQSVLNSVPKTVEEAFKKHNLTLAGFELAKHYEELCPYIQLPDFCNVYNWIENTR